MELQAFEVHVCAKAETRVLIKFFKHHVCLYSQSVHTFHHFIPGLLFEVIFEDLGWLENFA